MDPAAILSVIVKADVSAASRNLRSVHNDLDATARKATGAGDDIDKAARKGSKSLGLVKTAAGTLGGIVAFETVRRGVGLMVGEFEESRKVSAQTRAALKSTGGAANVTAGDIGKLASAISRKAGIDDEAIQSGENLLLTFTNIRNEVGKGNDIFNRATQATTDMSAALGQDMKSSAIQLGKALNDPIKGVTALQRVGVAFTEQQKDQIKALTESGDRLGAQKLILREINKEFGGSAAAKATPLDKLAVSMGNLAEIAGGVAAPAMDKIAGGLTRLFNGMQSGTGVGGALVSVFRAIGTVVTETAALIATLIGWFRQHETVSLALGAALGVVAAGFLAVKVQAGIAALIAAVTGAVTALNIALLANPIVLVVAALAALAAGLVVAYKKSETFRTVVNAAWKAVKDAATALWTVSKTVFAGIVSVVTTAWNAIKTVTMAVWAAIGGYLKAEWSVFKTVASTAWNVIKTAIVEPLREAFKIARDVLGNDGLLGWFKDRFDDFKKAAEALAQPFIASFKTMADGVEKLLGFLEKVIGAVKDVIKFIGDIKVPSIKLPNLNPFGGSGGGNVGPGGSPPARVDGFNDDAARFGNVVTSGYRPGDDGWHGQNRARDYAGGNMLGFATYMAAMFGGSLLELIHTPLGFGIKNGQPVPLSYWGSAVNADHYDHVHVALANGGHVKGSGWAVVGERGPELAHLPGGTDVYSNQDSRGMLGGGGPTVNIYTLHPGDPRTLRAVADAAAAGAHYQGRGGSSSRVKAGI